MIYAFDPAKDAVNRAKHGVSLKRADELRIETVVRDERYGELRFRAYGRLDGLIYCLAFTIRPDGPRAISLRRSHRKEFSRHVRD